MSSAVAMLLRVWQHCVAILIMIYGGREQALETDAVAQTESNYSPHNPERPVRGSRICGNNGKKVTPTLRDKRRKADAQQRNEE
jgi:hypothetical protein